MPGDAVATVDGQAIERQDFDHWLRIAAKSSDSALPDPATGYRKCIAARRKALPAPAKGRHKVTDAQLARQCKQDYARLRDQVMQLLISFKWISGEAAAQGITVTDAEVDQSFQKQKRQSFPTDADFRKFLKRSGQTQEDILERVRLDLLSSKLRDKVTAGKDQVSDEAIAQFYADNESRFAEPEKRALRVVLTKREADAKRARSALERGTSWKAVAKRYSIDATSKRAGGKVPAERGNAGPPARKGGLQRRRAPAGRPDPFAVRLLRLHGHSVTGPPTAARGGQGNDQGHARLAGAAGGARRLRRDFTARWRAKTECAGIQDDRLPKRPDANADADADRLGTRLPCHAAGSSRTVDARVAPQLPQR